MTPTKEIAFSDIQFANDPEYQDIRNSLKEYGYLGGCVVNTRTNTLVSGHQRVKIMQDMGMTKASFATVDLSPTDEKKLNVVMNKVSGRWSAPDLSALLRDLQSEGIDLGKLGFRDPKELNLLLTGSPKATKRDPDDAPRAPDDDKALTNTGDLYEITTDTGYHIIKCGDSTDHKDMQALCGDYKARVVFTDPPYGVSYAGTAQNQGNETLIANDDLRGSALKEFLRAAYTNCHAHSRSDAALYSFYASRNHIEFEQALIESGWRVKQVLNWFKSMVLGRADFHWSHEPILYSAKMGENCQWLGTRTETTIFETTAEDIAQLSKEQAINLLLEMQQHSDCWLERKDPPTILQHPNQKPVSLASRAIKSSSLPNEHILEPFLGSGSTLIACELHRRNCLGMELSRGHMDSIIRRFAETFENAKFTRNGKKFDPAKVHAST